ncbi:DapH/DapD/GlmU-related protein [Lysobacter sp. F6437]|uniref:DapH/DapD/GlmU-related protein n=1 Tax=Lysobacter sp. F6437 TaxID=3459296 RepID=UPI00403E2D6C
MSSWSTPLARLLEQVSVAFGISEIRDPEVLGLARQTGFVWTAQAGIVCLAMNREYLATARDNPDVVAIILPPALAGRETVAGKALIACEKADQLYHHLHLGQVVEPQVDAREVDVTAFIDASAVLRGDVRVGPGAHIGPRVVINGPVEIGRDVRVDAGAVVGCEGLYAKTILGVRQHVPHFGGVSIGEGAFIHAGAVIVRSAVRGEATRIGKDAHIGILSNIGHDVQVGEAATVSSNVVIAGRATVGARAWIGASATVSNMVVVGEGSEVRLGAVVIQDVPAKGDVSGNFALPHGRNMKRFLKENRDEP